MVKPILDFAARLGFRIDLNERLVMEKHGRYFLLTENLQSLVASDFFYAGTYLGKLKGGRFFPSFSLLSMIGENEANKVFVDAKAAWLFICGRDIFRRGIRRAVGSKREGSYVLVMNEFEECLGFGRLLSDLDDERKRVMVQNISDVGDFLRREKLQS